MYPFQSVEIMFEFNRWAPVLQVSSAVFLFPFLGTLMAARMITHHHAYYS